ncbi:uncharacterized protein BDR25DRAFT_278026 [Lindgomyces ingoldianus]|uniref:Uncharacterized protein n=1 Tax=Lindgomyces ingoldianus TaxID=673940 RepID=A0ACB6RBM3_9PLEO|nr:uncharacterized protein BDR25DRAFT_278026 [Lindgomyces ingoldianus]KAF2476719.1 hypothetical protein BDR25DRAFT_278026 [Lindgomyces ingoldianus]
MPSRQRQTADALVCAFNNMDNDAILSLRAPDCMRQILPLSLNFPAQSNAKYLANLSSMKSLFTSFQIRVDDVIEDLVQRKIVMFVTALGQTPVGEYNNEYVWKMKFDEAGEKIVEWSEFVDVGMVKDFYPRLVAEIKRREEEKEKGS